MDDGAAYKAGFMPVQQNLLDSPIGPLMAWAMPLT
jgi:hypothetical protein